MTSVSMEVFKLSQKSNRSPPYTEIANVVGYEGNARSDIYIYQLFMTHRCGGNCGQLGFKLHVWWLLVLQ